MTNPFTHSRRHAESALLDNVAAVAGQVNALLASGVRSITFPPGLADGAVQVLNEAGGWVASVRERGEENSRVIVKVDPAAPRSDGCPFISYEQARAQSLEHVGKAANQINEQFYKGVRAFVQPIGLIDDLVSLINEPVTGLRAVVTQRDEDDQMVGRFVVSDFGEHQL
jgi:hypothetical protein